MRHTYLIFILTLLCQNLSGQVLDSTFGILGSFAPNSHLIGNTACDFDGRYDQAHAIFHLEDGRMILAGDTRGADGSDFALARLLPNGHYDETAGPDGEIRIDLGYQNDSCLAAARYQSDKILMGGCVRLPGQDKYVILIVRVDLDGKLDIGFGNAGKVVIDLPASNEMATKILAQQDGKVIVAGNVLYSSHGNSLYFPDSTSVFVGRQLSDGKIDSSFGTNGFIYRRYEDTCNAALLGDVILDKNGCVVVTGGSYHPYPGGYDGEEDFCTHNIHVCRYLPNGQPDATFGTNGVVELPYSEGKGTALHAYEDGKVLMAGVVSDLLFPQPIYSFATRLLPDGTLDSTFGTNGRFFKYVQSGGTGSEPVDILVMRDKIILGIISDPNGDHTACGAFCLNKDGQINTAFGNNGKFLFYPMIPILYFINNITSTDSIHFFLSGYYSAVEPNNMIVIKVVLKETTLISEVTQPSNLSIYPNPTSDIFYLDLPTIPPAEKIHLLVKNFNGVSVLNQDIYMAEANRGVDISTLSNGLYLVEIISKKAWGMGKVVIQK